MKPCIPGKVCRHFWEALILSGATLVGVPALLVGACYVLSVIG